MVLHSFVVKPLKMFLGTEVNGTSLQQSPIRRGHHVARPIQWSRVTCSDVESSQTITWNV